VNRHRAHLEDPAGAPPRPAPRLAYAALVAALLLAGLFAVFPNPGRDIWWHLKTGEVILTQHRVPTTDLFTYTAAGRPWVTHEWLADVVFHGLDRLGGLDLLILFTALLAVAALALAAAAALVGDRTGERIAAVALGVLLAGPLLATRAFARPHMFTAVLLGLVLLLLRLEQTTGRRRYRLALVPVFLFWANLHAGFVLGILLVALSWLGDAWQRRRAAAGAPWRPRLVTGIAIVLVTLLNPNHVQALLYPLLLVSRSEIRDAIQELQSIFHPDYRGALWRLDLAVLGLVTAVLLVGSRRRLVWPVLLPGIAFAVLAVRNLRGVSEFAVLVPVLVGVHGAWLGRRRALALGVPAAVLLAVAVGVPAVFRWGVPMGPGPARRPGFGVATEMSLESVTRFLRVIGPEGRLFNLLGFGGYLIHDLWPERQVFIDGRLDIYPPGFLAAYGRLLATGEGWDELCERWGIALAVVDDQPGPSGDYGLRRRLRNDPDWVCVFFTSNAIVYARRGPPLDDVIARYGSPFDPGAVTSPAVEQFVATAPPADVERAIGAVTAWLAVVPDDPFLPTVMGQLLEAAGRAADAVPWLRLAVRRQAETVELRLLLSRALIKADSLAAARTELDALRRDLPDRVEPLLLTAALQQQTGDLAGALASVRQAQALVPGHPAVRRSLAILEEAARKAAN